MLIVKFLVGYYLIGLVVAYAWWYNELRDNGTRLEEDYNQAKIEDLGERVLGCAFLWPFLIMILSVTSITETIKLCNSKLRYSIGYILCKLVGVK